MKRLSVLLCGLACLGAQPVLADNGRLIARLAPMRGEVIQH